jgi:hypothetical protein
MWGEVKVVPDSESNQGHGDFQNSCQLQQNNVTFALHRHGENLRVRYGAPAVAYTPSFQLAADIHLIEYDERQRVFESTMWLKYCRFKYWDILPESWVYAACTP